MECLRRFGLNVWQNVGKYSSPTEHIGMASCTANEGLAWDLRSARNGRFPVVTGMLDGEALPHTDMWSKQNAKEDNSWCTLEKLTWNSISWRFGSKWFSFSNVIFRFQLLIFEGCIRSEKFCCQLPVSLGGKDSGTNLMFHQFFPYLRCDTPRFSLLTKKAIWGCHANIYKWCCVFSVCLYSRGFQKRSPKRIHNVDFSIPHIWGSKG